jgi:hypothetical protein
LTPPVSGAPVWSGTRWAASSFAAWPRPTPSGWTG